MAVEYLANPVQAVALNAPVLMDASIPCTRGYVYHEDGTGIFILRGIVNNACANYATYQLTFNGNIALPRGGTGRTRTRTRTPRRDGMGRYSRADGSEHIVKKLESLMREASDAEVRDAISTAIDAISVG